MSRLSKEVSGALADYRHEMALLKKEQDALDARKEEVFKDFLNRCDAIHRENKILDFVSFQRSGECWFGEDKQWNGN